MAPSSAQAERGFSQLKLVKTDIRSKLGQSALNHSLAIKFLSKDIKDFDPKEAFGHWNKSSVLPRRPNVRTKTLAIQSQSSQSEHEMEGVQTQESVQESVENEIHVVLNEIPVESNVSNDVEGDVSEKSVSEDESDESEMSEEEESVYERLKEIEREIEREEL